MATMERPTTRKRERRVSPHIAALIDRIVAEDREVYATLAAYDRGEVSLPDPPARVASTQPSLAC